MLDENRISLLKSFQSNLDINFKDVDLLHQALLHSSYVNERHDEKDDNETLEFLGDSVLALIVNEYLFVNYNEYREGELSRIKSIVVSEFSLSEIAREIDLASFLLLGKGEEQSGGLNRRAILADAMEALLGAYFLDSGLDSCRDFILPYLKKEISKIIKQKHKKDYKTDLQLHVQQRYKSCPVYETIKEEGPDHNKIFYVDVYINNKLYGSGIGNNKKSAQQDAAKHALDKFR